MRKSFKLKLKNLFNRLLLSKTKDEEMDEASVSYFEDQQEFASTWEGVQCNPIK